MAFLDDSVYDAALNVVKNNATILHICSGLPANYAGIAAVTLGNKASPAFTGPTDATPNGRKVTVTAITDGTVTGTGTATHYAIASGSVLLAANTITSQAVTSGNTFTTPAIIIRQPDAA
jgi:hypothetical protein